MARWLVFALANLMLLPLGLSYHIPGGINPVCYGSALVSAVLPGLCFYRLRSAGILERITRMLCAATCVFVLGTIIAFQFEYSDRVHYTYHG